MARRSSKNKRRNRDAGEVQQLPWQRLKNPYSPIEVLPPEAVEAVHEASMEVLENLGIEFLLPRALDLLKAAGAHVDKETNLVRMDRGLVLEAVAKAPDCFKLTARNTDRYVEFGHNNINFDSVGGPPFSSDLDNGRRTGNFEDFSNFVKLTQALDVVHICGGVPIAPIELNAETRHLDCYYSIITQTDKVWHASGLGKQRMADAIDMLCIARGKTRDEITKEPGLFTTINSNSPRRFDGPMLEGLMEAAEFGQALSITPFTLSGAMSPATLAGSLVQQNAEALAGIAFAQIVAPSTPCIYGGFTSNVDMKTGSPAFGTPEYTKACLASGQMARRYGLPFRSSNTNASNAVDAQATYETSMSLWGSIMGHANIVHHGVGWLEGGLTASFEKAIIDAEMLQMMAEFMRPVDVSEKALAVDIIKEVEPGGHYFGTSQTMEIFETAFYSPILSDWRNFETWEENGSVTATERANKVWKQLLENYEEPALDPSIAEELKAFIAQRKKEEKVDVS
jgi:trimethylamine--corrinoid protein Co-methyltransferase